MNLVLCREIWSIPVDRPRDTRGFVAVFGQKNTSVGRAVKLCSRTVAPPPCTLAHSVLRIDDSARRNYPKCFTRGQRRKLVPGGAAMDGGWRERGCCVIFQKQKTNSRRRRRHGVVAVSTRFVFGDVLRRRSGKPWNVWGGGGVNRLFVEPLSVSEK